MAGGKKGAITWPDTLQNVQAIKRSCAPLVWRNPALTRCTRSARACGREQGSGVRRLRSCTHAWTCRGAPQRDAAPQRSCRRALAPMRAAMPDNLDCAIAGCPWACRALLGAGGRDAHWKSASVCDACVRVHSPLCARSRMHTLAHKHTTRTHTRTPAHSRTRTPARRQRTRTAGGRCSSWGLASSMHPSLSSTESRLNGATAPPATPTQLPLRTRRQRRLPSMCACRVRVRVCVCACVCVRARARSGFIAGAARVRMRVRACCIMCAAGCTSQ